MKPKTLLETIKKALEEMKAIDPVTVHLGPEHSAFDDLVIASGSSNRHVAAIADCIREEVKKKHHLSPLGVEGEREAEWVLIDYGALIVHLFQEEARSYYNLEGLWVKSP